MPRRRSICIISLSPIASDGRVLRQIEYLAPRYDLTVAGYGEPPPRWANVPGVRWVALPERQPLRERAARLRRGELAQLGPVLRGGCQRLLLDPTLRCAQVLPALYPWCEALARPLDLGRFPALGAYHDAFHANDCDTLAFASRAARTHRARLVVDLHEYAPLEFENQPNWWLREPMIRDLLRRHAARADAVLTVAPAIAERYHKEFGFDSVVLLNAPERVPLPPPAGTGDVIHLVHHGIASPIRKPELMIETVARCDGRYRLHLMFMPSLYVQELKALAERVAPGRVFFHDPVQPDMIVPTLARFDVAFPLIAPTNYNYLVCLPNKFFEGLAAGLAVCTGPSPSMAELVRQYQCGIVARSFEPVDIAAALNGVSCEKWASLRQAARNAAEQMHAAAEMQKLLRIYERLFRPEDSQARSAILASVA